MNGENQDFREELERLFNLSLDLLCIAGTDGYFKRVNPAFERVLGYSREQLLSRSFLDFVHPDDRADTIVAIEKLARGLLVVDFQNRYQASDGTYRWLAWRSAPDETGRLIYAVARDITASKRTEAELARKTQELERSNRDLEDFAAVASHDLRAPLRAIANLSEWLEADMPGELPESVREIVRKLRGQVQRMEALTEDLLAYARAGTASFDVSTVDVGSLVERIVGLGHLPSSFSVQAEGELPVFETWRAPLEQVLRNLIGNAVKHHDREDGRVLVSAQDQGRYYRFSVVDDGPGIPPESRQRIFEMFHRLRPAEDREGSGMGLALVKRIVERNGGRIWLESEARGAAFHFTWPKRPEAPGA